MGRWRWNTTGRGAMLWCCAVMICGLLAGEQRAGVTTPLQDVALGRQRDEGVVICYAPGRVTSVVAPNVSQRPVDDLAAKPVPAFSLTGITPNRFNPAVGESTTIAYTVPEAANVQVAVRDGGGAAIRLLLTAAVSPGAATVVWDGRNDAGVVVADAVYTVAIEGTTASGTSITAASGQVRVAIPLPQPVDYGQTLEGVGSANYNWLQSADVKFAIAFRAPKSGAITEITAQWRTATGYCDGNLGRFTFELQTNGLDDFPSGTVIGRATGIRPVTDGYVVVPIAAMLGEGQIYHLVITNTAANPDLNWSSPNTLMTRVHPWDATGFCAAAFVDGGWHPWSSRWNEFNKSGDNYVNGSHSPLMLRWSDGSTWGDPYWSSAVSSSPMQLWDRQQAGEQIVWNQPDVTIRQIGISVKRVGYPGPLLYQLEEVKPNGLATRLASGTIASATQVSSQLLTWVYASLRQPVTLRRGHTYRLWFNNPCSHNRKNRYEQYPVYGREEIPEWLEGGYGGTKSCYIYGSGTGWYRQTTHDLTFSLRGELER